MRKSTCALLGFILLAQTSAYAINDKYREQLERSGCTQLSELEGCDITKTREQNAKAGFGNDNKPAEHDAHNKGRHDCKHDEKSEAHKNCKHEGKHESHHDNKKKDEHHHQHDN